MGTAPVSSLKIHAHYSPIAQFTHAVSFAKVTIFKIFRVPCVPWLKKLFGRGPSMISAGFDMLEWKEAIKIVFPME